MIQASRFVEQYPEFQAIYSQNPGYVQGVVNRIDRSIDASVANREDLVFLAIAADIARSPIGRGAQLSNKDGSSSYSIAFRAECDARASLRFY